MSVRTSLRTQSLPLRPPRFPVVFSRLGRPRTQRRWNAPCGVGFALGSIRTPIGTVEFSDDGDCMAFMESVWPQHLDTYLGLNPVERADFWRYLVVLHHGGLYTDADTICRKPLSDWMQPEDEAVIGIDGDYLNKFPTWEPEGHVMSGGAYNLSLWWHDNIVAFSNWTFAFQPGHPILAETVRRIEINVEGPVFPRHTPRLDHQKDRSRRADGRHL